MCLDLWTCNRNVHWAMCEDGFKVSKVYEWTVNHTRSLDATMFSMPIVGWAWFHSHLFLEGMHAWILDLMVSLLFYIKFFICIICWTELWKRGLGRHSVYLKSTYTFVDGGNNSNGVIIVYQKNSLFDSRGIVEWLLCSANESKEFLGSVLWGIGVLFFSFEPCFIVIESFFKCFCNFLIAILFAPIDMELQLWGDKIWDLHFICY